MFLKFLSLYDITKEDLEKFPSLLSRFSPEFKKKLGEKVKEFTLKNLPDSANIILNDVSPNAFAGTIEKFLNLLLTRPEQAGVYLKTVAQTHLDANIKISEFMSSYAEFYREIVLHLDTQEETIRKFLLFVYLAGIYAFIQQVENLPMLQDKDPITGLPSKRLLILKMKKYLDEYNSFVLLDTDRFGEINLYHGYNTGNAVLAVIASMLQSIFPDAYIVRFQNDEFIIMDKNDTVLVKEKLHLLAKNLREQPHALPLKQDESLNIEFSAVIIDTKLCKGLDFESVIWVAYESLRWVKEHYISAKEVITEERFKELLERKSKLNKIARAIYEKSTVIAAQKVVDAFSGETVFYEVLARLVLPAESGRIVPASHFIHLISNSHLEAELDKSVVEKMLDNAHRLKPLKKISLNVSSFLLQREFSWLVGKLKRTILPFENIILELSERKGITEEAEVKNRLKELKKIGIPIVIDDFGIQYSNYYILKAIEVDGIKIDGSIVKDICNSDADRIFVEGIIRLAREMGIFVVAEYVESKEIADLLIKMAMKNNFRRLYLQGYYIEKPSILIRNKV